MTDPRRTPLPRGVALDVTRVMGYRLRRYLEDPDDSDLLSVGEVLGTTGEITVTDNGDGTITISLVEDPLIVGEVLGTTGEITVTDNLDGTITLSLVDDPLTVSEVLGTVDGIVVTDNLDGTITLSLVDSPPINMDFIQIQVFT